MSWSVSALAWSASALAWFASALSWSVSALALSAILVYSTSIMTIVVPILAKSILMLGFSDIIKVVVCAVTSFFRHYFLGFSSNVKNSLSYF